jgi:hypothetical protein
MPQVAILPLIQQVVWQTAVDQRLPVARLLDQRAMLNMQVVTGLLVLPESLQEPVVVGQGMPVQGLMHQELRVVLADLLEGVRVVMAGHQPVSQVRMEHRSVVVAVMASPGARLPTVVLEPTDR